MPNRFEPRQHRIDVGALTLNHLDYSDLLNNRAPLGTILTLHGQADSAWSMHSIALEFGDRYRVLSLDLRGHGLSDRGGYAVLQMVADLAGAIDALDLTDPIIVGHSLGGQVSSQFCGIYPAVARALVLVEGMGPPVDSRRPSAGVELTDDQAQLAWARRVADLMRQPYRSRTFDDLDAAVERFRAGHPGLSPDRALHLVERSTRVLDNGAHEWLFDPATRDWLAGHDQERAYQRWRSIDCPVLVVNGGDAWARFWSQGPSAGAVRYSDAAHAQRMANFANAYEVVIPAAGHMVQYDQPEALNQAIDEFLTRL
ncbi:MAG: alpha/beta hydrolase [Acidimicrobiales bacterium]|nr:alpha/beta hydrolase [Acidimicrobiales bacterium]